MGRNYDYEMSYKEEVIFIPKQEEVCGNKYDILGIGSGLFPDYPMLYDGMNEKGLAMSGLAFTDNAHYHKYLKPNIVNYKPYSIIPTILGNYESVKQFQEIVVDKHYVNIIDAPYNNETANAELHWFLCDKDDCLVIESTKNGVNIYVNNYGVLTNNPPFPLMEDECKDILRKVGIYTDYESDMYFSRGTETQGLSGGYTSAERFARLVYLKQHIGKYDMLSPVDDSFKLCQSVEQLYGCTPVDEKFEYTIYQAVYDLEELKLYTKPYKQGYVDKWGFADNVNEIDRCVL